jgi:hypothetical protein
LFVVLRSAICYVYFSKSSVPNDSDLSLSLCPDETMVYVLNEEFIIDDYKNQEQKSYNENNNEHQKIDEICVPLYANFSSQSQSRSRSRSNSS